MVNERAAEAPPSTIIAPQRPTGVTEEQMDEFNRQNLFTGNGNFNVIPSPGVSNVLRQGKAFVLNKTQAPVEEAPNLAPGQQVVRMRNDGPSM
jgi:hypothetical protein